MNKFLTVDEAAQLLRVRPQTLYKWICQRKIPSIAIGGRTLFDETEIENWVEQRRRAAL